MSIDRQGLDIELFDLNLTFHWYGLIIVLGILAATGVVAWMARRDERDPDHVWNGVLWVVVLAVIFARLWHVFFPSINSTRSAEWYLTHPFDLHEGPFIIWEGGLSIFGAVIGGALGVIIYAYRNRLNIINWLDMVAVTVPLGQAIGRWGNFVNEELYGEPTNLPWGLNINNPNYAEGTRFHPLFLYESLWNLLTFGVLLALWLRYRDRLKTGDFILMYLIAYPVARFLLEFLRLEVTMVGDVNVSQAFSAAVAVIAAGVLAFRHREALRSLWQRLSARGESQTT
jgi:phosphatidylglycerol---prolipoprotein diacylglyceryl transferase